MILNHDLPDLRITGWGMNHDLPDLKITGWGKPSIYHGHPLILKIMVQNHGSV
jgi:hypothetical protein